MNKRYLVCYFTTVITLLLFDGAFLMAWIPLMILFGIAFAGCLVWFCKLMEKSESWSYKQIRKISGKMNDIEKDMRIMQFEIRGKADADIDINALVTNNVRPGSKPSITYANMKAIEEGEYDLRGKAETTQSEPKSDAVCVTP